MYYAVTDLECTGLDPWRNEILTISTIVADEKFKELGRYTGKIRPRNWEWWSDDAEAVHGISKEDALSFGNSADVLDDYLRFLREFSSGAFSFVCHALPLKSRVDLYDRNFLFAWMWYHNKRSDYYRVFPEENMRSTIRKKRSEAQRLWGMTSQKLDAWMDKLGIDKTGHHNSEFDSEVCLKILEYQENFEGRL